MSLKENAELIINGSEKLTSYSKDFFSYLREPYANAESHLIQEFQRKGIIDETDIEIAAAHLMVRKWVRKIRNRNSIISKANKQFDDILRKAENKNHNVHFNKPDEDWLEYFEDLSSNVSNEVLQDIWALLLIREHLNAGNVQKVMLNTLALMDSKTCIAFSKLCELTYNLTIGDETRSIPLVIYDHDIRKITLNNDKDDKKFEDYLEFCPNDDDLELLSEIGLITMNLLDREYSIYFPGESEALFECEGFSRIAKGVYDEDDDVYTVFTGYAFFTQIGLSLYKMLNFKTYQYLPVILNGFVDAKSI